MVESSRSITSFNLILSPKCTFTTSIFCLMHFCLFLAFPGPKPSWLDAKGSRMGFFLIKLLMNIPSMKPCLSCTLTKKSLLRNKERKEIEVGLKNHQYPHAGINTPVFSNHAPHTFQDFKAGRCDGLTSYLTLCCTMPTC